MTIKTYPCTVSQCHSTGMTVVSCLELAYTAAFITDDFGNLQPARMDKVLSVDHFGSH